MLHHNVRFNQLKLPVRNLLNEAEAQILNDIGPLVKENIVFVDSSSVTVH